MARSFGFWICGAEGNLEKYKTLQRCRCMSLPLNPKVQGGGRRILAGFSARGRHTL